MLRLALAIGAALATSPVAAQSLADRLDALGAGPCPDSNLTCVTLNVPRDHFANDQTETLPITFAVSLASEPSAGIMFYAVGGPGGSGQAAAEGYISGFDEQVQTRLDFVFFDQRGVGPDHGLACPLAQGQFDRSSPTLTDAPALLEVVQAYVSDCQAELAHLDVLPFVGTDQAIRDLEAFRQAIGAPKVWLYGESYGTQFMQVYATAYPDAPRGVILDGVVDLNLSEAGFYRTYVLSAEHILSRLFDECDGLNACATDMEGPASVVHDDLVARLVTEPARVEFPLLIGGSEPRVLTSAMLESTVFLSLYGPDGRSAYLRALADAAQGDLVPMLRLAYANLYIDSETEEGMSDPSWFGAAYFAINCLDYADGRGTPEDEAGQILQEARDLAPEAPRLLRSYYLERLVCAYWPAPGKASRPEPFAGGDYPTLILNADTDPITSVAMAYSVLDHVQNGAIVVMQGGPHVIWGRGLTCPDVTVQRLLLEGTAPAAPVQLCKQDFLAPYSPLTLTGDLARVDAYALGQAIEAELAASADFTNWSYSDVLEFSCDHGGRIKANPTDTGAAMTFTGCAFWPDVPLYGSGTITFSGDQSDILVLDLSVLGPVKGQFTYTADHAAGTAWVTGNLNGKPATTPRPLP